MKRLLFIFLIVLIGCDSRRVSNFSEGAIVSDVESTLDNTCWYYTATTDGLGWLYKGVFADKCGRFTVGDTIRLVKTGNPLKP